MPRSGQSICSCSPALGDRLVLALHRVRDRVQVLLARRVVVVAEEERDHAGRGGVHERGVAVGGLDQVLDVVAGLVGVLDRDRSGAGRGPAAAAPGIAEHLLLERGERLDVLVDERVRLAAEAVEAVGDVGDVAGLAHLAVGDDVDAGVALLARRPRRRPRGCAARARPDRPARPPAWRTSSGSGHRGGAGCPRGW